MKALKQLEKDKPHIWAVLSFADSTENHKGIIYRASNFVYCGMGGKATFYLDKNNRLRHPRQAGVNITKEKAIQLGWKPVKRDGKYRYLYIQKHIKAKNLPQILLNTKEKYS